MIRIARWKNSETWSTHYRLFKTPDSSENIHKSFFRTDFWEWLWYLAKDTFGKKPSGNVVQETWCDIWAFRMLKWTNKWHEESNTPSEMTQILITNHRLYTLPLRSGSSAHNVKSALQFQQLSDTCIETLQDNRMLHPDGWLRPLWSDYIQLISTIFSRVSVTK